ncbi:MAG TPA: hypothetical protein VFT66_08950 [Roseiflexaceae bacterium]|nr:hypothetical protein [Roseiflexaceae bacterium]
MIVERTDQWHDQCSGIDWNNRDTDIFDEQALFFNLREQLRLLIGARLHVVQRRLQCRSALGYLGLK